MKTIATIAPLFVLLGCGTTVRVYDRMSAQLWFVDGVQQDSVTPDDDAREVVARLGGVAGYFQTLLTKQEIERMASFKNIEVGVNNYVFTPGPPAAHTCRNGHNASCGLRGLNEPVINACDNSVGVDTLGLNQAMNSPRIGPAEVVRQMAQVGTEAPASAVS